MIVAVKKNGVVCIGSDTQVVTETSRKYSSEDVLHNEKVLLAGKSYIGAEGDASLPLVLKSYFSSLKRQPTFKNSENIFEALIEMHRALKDRYFLITQQDSEDSFESMGFQMLIANSHGIFGTYSQRSVQEFSRFYAIGDGANYAFGALEAIYDNVKSAEELVRSAISIASEFDVNVGSVGKIYKIKLA